MALTGDRSVASISFLNLAQLPRNFVHGMGNCFQKRELSSEIMEMLFSLPLWSSIFLFNRCGVPYQCISMCKFIIKQRDWKMARRVGVYRIYRSARLSNLFLKKSSNDKDGLMFVLQEGYCKTKSLKTGARIHSYRRVKRYNREALKKALAYHGPTTISINANPKTLKFYSHGVLDDISCSK